MPPDLMPAKFCRQLFVSWQSVPNGHGVLRMVIVHSQTEREEYRLQQVPKKFYVQLLCMPEPERLMNDLLRMYLGE